MNIKWMSQKSVNRKHNILDEEKFINI